MKEMKEKVLLEGDQVSLNKTMTIMESLEAGKIEVKICLLPLDLSMPSVRSRRTTQKLLNLPILPSLTTVVHR